MIDVDRLQPGEAIPAFERRGSFAAWTRFAAVNYEIADHHMDDEVARHEGFPSAFGSARFIQPSAVDLRPGVPDSM